MDDNNSSFSQLCDINGVPIPLKISDPVGNSISFHTSNGEWVMAIKDSKILFNRDRWPEASPDDFAKAVITILEISIVDMTSLKKQVPFENE